MDTKEKNRPHLSEEPDETPGALLLLTVLSLLGCTWLWNLSD